MNALSKIIAGLTIIQAVEPDTSLRADHDEVWAGEDLDKYSDEQKAQLDNLGWSQDEGCGWHRYV
jgi:hypothetical protein